MYRTEDMQLSVLPLCCALLLVLSCAVISTLVAMASPMACAESFQDQLNSLLQAKLQCSHASFRDCCQIKRFHSAAPSGQYELGNYCYFDRFGDSTQLARCDMHTDGGGWLVIQRRVAGGTVNFFRGWVDYENGFGDLDGEFWYGLRNIHCLTTRSEVELRIDAVQTNGERFSWVYQRAVLNGPDTNYTLTLGPGDGPVFNGMAGHNGLKFSTYDRDNDRHATANCAQDAKGGWWYDACFTSNLNGRHGPATDPGVVGSFTYILWRASPTSWLHLRSVEMKIRPASCSPEQY